MSLIDLLHDKEVWERFYEYKLSLACPKQFVKALRGFIDGREYLPVCDRIALSEAFPLPRKAIISKHFSDKLRTVYIYPEPENTVLKLLTYLLCRRFDVTFPDNLYSFRPGRSARDAVNRFRRMHKINDLYAYKVDIHNYFNSIPVEKLLPLLQEKIGSDEKLYSFLSSLLSEEYVYFGKETIKEPKGIMAGTPLSAFYANLYLEALDRRFQEAAVPYARYSDDIIVFGCSMGEVEEYAEQIRAFLNQYGLTVNSEKEHFYTPEQGFSFLGFDYRQGKLDIAAASIEKIKGKMRRKARALERWQRKNGLEGEKAAKAFIRIFNRKLYESPADNELSWSRWYFPAINTDNSLKIIDHYAQECIRFLLTGKRTKARFNARYEDLKRLGYRNLVHEYHSFRQRETC